MLALMEQQAPQALKAPKVLLVLLVHRAKLAPQDQLVHKATLARLARKANLVQQDPPVLSELTDQPGQRGLPGTQALQGTLDLSVLLALVERQVPQVLREQMVIIMFLKQLRQVPPKEMDGSIAVTVKPMSTTMDIGLRLALAMQDPQVLQGQRERPQPS